MSVISKLATLGAAGAGGGDYWISLLGGTGNDYGRAVAVDSADNIIINGQRKPLGSSNGDFLTAKYDSSGTLQWSRIIYGFYNDSGSGVAIDSSDNIIVTGSSNSGSIGNTFSTLTAKYNPSGTLLWKKSIYGSSNDSTSDVAIDSSDNIVITGYTQSDGAGGYDLFIAKYNSSGTLLWQKTLGGSGSDFGIGVAIDSSDNIVITGYTQSDGAGNSDMLVAKYNSSGTLLWDKTLGGSDNDYGFGVVIDSSDNIIVAGYTQSVGAGGADVLVVKYNSSGTLLWQKTLGGSGNDYGYAVALDSAENIIVTGQTASDGAGGTDALVAKYDSSGTLLWDKTLGGAGGDYGQWLAVDSSDSIVITGYTTSDGAGNADILVAKLPPNGTGNGTYGNLVYQNAVLTDAEAVLTDAAAVLTDAAAALPYETPGWQESAIVLTEEFFKVTP